MKRKEFLRKTAMVGGALAASPSIIQGKVRVKNSDYDKLKEQIGFNHLPNKEERTMNTVIHRAETRGHANHGWLDTNHTFSFANYHNAERMHFGVLRVLNDDKVSAGMGFGTHPHDNMEIISIPLKGDLEHQDNMGNKTLIKEGDIQVMSAGTGVLHSEYNPNEDKSSEFLQIWLFPKERNVEPRYDQITLNELAKKNEFYQVLSPNADDEGVWIHQNAWFHLGNFDSGAETGYQLKDAKNGVYAFVIEGEVEINGEKLSRRDGMGLWDSEDFALKANKESKVLIMEVPMQL